MNKNQEICTKFFVFFLFQYNFETLSLKKVKTLSVNIFFHISNFLIIALGGFLSML